MIVLPLWALFLIPIAVVLVAALHFVYARWFMRKLDAYQRQIEDLMGLIAEHRHKERTMLIELMDRSRGTSPAPKQEGQT